MGFGGISIWNLLIILVIVVLLFGTKRLRGLGADLGSAIKGFRNSVKEPETPTNQADSLAVEQKPAVTAQQTTSTAEPVKPTDQR